MIERESDAPDLEDLAAYVDGRLSGERKAQVEERLARDEDYYDVFMENVHFLQEQSQQEQAEEGGGEVVAPAAWWRSWRVVAPLVVAATLVAAIGLGRLSRGPATAEWVARLDAVEIVGLKYWDHPGWTTTRGAPVSPDVRQRELEQTAFRLGARTIDLQVALSARSREEAEIQARRLAILADNDDHLLGMGLIYRELEKSLEDGQDFQALEQRAVDAEAFLKESLGEPAARRFDLGTWMEAGRLAARAGNYEVLAGIVRRGHLARPIDEIQTQLDALERLLDQPELDATDFETAASTFGEIAKALGG